MVAKLHRIYLSIGSNIDPVRHLRAALAALTREFGQLLISRVYESESVGFSGANFYNLVVGFDSGQSVALIAATTHRIEQVNGRQRTGERFGPRTLDIDILTHGSSSGRVDGIDLPRGEILENAFVLLPLADIAGDERHPVMAKTYRELAKKIDTTEQKIWPVDFIWRGRSISSQADKSPD
jgi:2-amino-4-hydroxy-6-hydroxymethyldihydropteridine diphosphokinase